MTTLYRLNSDFYKDKVLYHDGFRYLFGSYLRSKINPKVVNAERWYCDHKESGCNVILEVTISHNAEYDDMEKEVKIIGDHNHPITNDWIGYTALVVDKDEDLSLDFLDEHMRECKCVCTKEEKIQSVTHPDKPLTSINKTENIEEIILEKNVEQ
jgi:hypothetical protein